MAKRQIQCLGTYQCKTCGVQLAAGTLTVELEGGGIVDIEFEEDMNACPDCGHMIEDEDWADQYYATDGLGESVMFILNYEDRGSGMRGLKLDKETEQAIIELLRSLPIAD